MSKSKKVLTGKELAKALGVAGETLFLRSSDFENDFVNLVEDDALNDRQLSQLRDLLGMVEALDSKLVDFWLDHHTHLDEALERIRKRNDINA